MMQKFTYKAKNNSAQTIHGQIEANSHEEAVELISRLGLMPISVEETKGKKTDRSFFLLPKISSKEVYAFTRQLANLIKAGIPILRSLQILSEQENNPYFGDMIHKMQQEIKNGRSFSEALSAYPKIFSSFFVAMVQVGEEGGNLKEMLVRLADYQKNQQEMFSKIRAALAYPILMAILGVTTVIFLLTFIMPKITKLFSNLGEQLPLITRVLIGVSDFIRHGWLIIGLLIFILILALKRWSETSLGKVQVSHWKLRALLWGPLTLKVEVARFARTLELLLKSGIPLIKGLQITSPVLSNELIKQELVKCRESLESGSAMGTALRKSVYFPHMVANMISVGEETGSLETTLRDIADIYEQETNESIKTLTNLLEPLMILAVGLIVGFIVIAMLLPIFQIDLAIR